MTKFLPLFLLIIIINVVSVLIFVLVVSAASVDALYDGVTVIACLMVCIHIFIKDTHAHTMDGGGWVTCHNSCIKFSAEELIRSLTENFLIEF